MFAIMGAIFYTMVGVIIALIYNLIARIVGGYELVLEPVSEGMPLTPPGQPLTGYTGAPSYVPPSAPPPPTAPSDIPQAPPPPDMPRPARPDDQGTDQNRQT